MSSIPEIFRIKVELNFGDLTAPVIRDVNPTLAKPCTCEKIKDEVYVCLSIGGLFQDK